MRKTLKKVFSVSLALIASFGIIAAGFAGIGSESLALVKAAAGGEKVKFRTEFYRLDPVTNDWVYTERVKRGETVKARVYIDTDYYTTSPDLLFFYDNDFFSDNLKTKTAEDFTETSPDGIANVNRFPGSSAAETNVTGQYMKITDPFSRLYTDPAEGLVTPNGYIQENFAKQHTAITAGLRFNPDEAQKLRGGEHVDGAADQPAKNEWFVEFELQVRPDAGSLSEDHPGAPPKEHYDDDKYWGRFFVKDSTIADPDERPYGYVNVPYNADDEGTSENSLGMWLKKINAETVDYPVCATSSLILKGDGGNFAAPDRPEQYTASNYIGDAINKAAIPEVVRTGFEFIGWVPDGVANPSPSDVVEIPDVASYEDVVLKALWAPSSSSAASAKIDYYVDGVKMNNVDIIKNYGEALAIDDAAFAPPDFKPLDASVGRTVAGQTWYTDPAYSSPLPPGRTVVQVDDGLRFNLYVKSKCDAVYKLNDSVLGKESVEVGSYCPSEADLLPIASPGYEDWYWYPDPTATVMTASGQTFSALEGDLVFYDLIFTDTDPETGAPTDEWDRFPLNYGSLLETPMDPDEPTGYTFDAWYDKPADDPDFANAKSADDYISEDATMPDRDWTFYAKYDPNDYSITFDSDGGTPVPTIIQAYGTSLTRPADPVKSGYIFDDWYEIRADGTLAASPYAWPEATPAFDPPAYSENSLNLKAKWIDFTADDLNVNIDVAEIKYGGTAQITVEGDIPNGYRVEFSSSDESVFTVDASGKITAVDEGEADATVKLIDENGNEAIDKNGNKISVSKRISVTRAFTIRWITDGAAATSEVKSGDPIVKPDDPQKKGYVFKGWTPAVPATMPARDLTFTAVFLKFEILRPSVSSVSYGDSLILRAELEGELPAGAEIVWTADNDNFKKTDSADGKTCAITPAKSGETTFTATVKAADGTKLSSAEQKVTSKAGFFQKLIAFFKRIFGMTKIIEQAFGDGF